MSSLPLLKQHLINHGVFFGEYAPGYRSRMIYDCREALLTGGFLGYVGELLWSKIEKYSPQVLLGAGYGSLNIMLAIQIAAEKQGHHINTLVVRDKRKDHNRRKLIEGPFAAPNSRTVFVDDLMNTGATFRNSIKAASDEGMKLEIVAVAVLVDLWTFLGSRRLEAQGIPMERIFLRHDLGDTRMDPDSQVVSQLRWRSLINNQWSQGYVQCPPLVHQDRLYVAKDTHTVVCHDLSTGDIIWQHQGTHPLVHKGMACKMQIESGVLFAASYDGTISALDAITGRVIWKKYLDMFIHSSPCISPDRQQLYIGTEGGIQNKRGDIACLDLHTGSTLWRYPTQHVIPCSPRLVDSQVICGSNDSNLYSLDADTGELRWCAEGLGEIKGQVGVINDLILASTEQGFLYALSKNGAVVWRRSCGRGARHQFIQTNQALNLIYVTNEDGMVLAFDASGNQIWLRRLRAHGFWNLTQHGDQLLVVTGQGHMNLLDSATGDKLATTHLNMRVNCPAHMDAQIIAVHTESNGLFVWERRA